MKIFIWIFSISFGIFQISFLQAQSTTKQTVYCLYNYDVECSVTCKMVGFKSGDCHLGRCRCCGDSADQNKNSTQMLALSGLAIMTESSHCHGPSSSEADKTANVAKLSEELQQLGVNTLNVVVDPPAPPGDRVELEIQKSTPELVHFMSRLVRKIIKSCGTSTPVLKTSATTTDEITRRPRELKLDRDGDHGQDGQVSHVCSVCSSKFHPSGNGSRITPPHVCPTCFKKPLDIGANSTAESSSSSSSSSRDEKTRVCTFCSTKLRPVGTEFALGPPSVCPTCLRKLLQTHGADDDGENTELAGPDPTQHPPTEGVDDSGPLEKVAPTRKPAPAMHVCSICSHEFLRVDIGSATTGRPDICPTCLAKSLPLYRSDDSESVELRAAEEPAAAATTAAPAGPADDHSSHTCSVCSKRYWPVKDSKQPPGPPYICPACYEKSQPVTEQSDHSSHTCSICSKRYFPIFGSKQPPGPPYICPDCYKKSHPDEPAATTRHASGNLSPATSDVVQTASKPELQGLLADMLLLVGGELKVKLAYRSDDGSSSSIDSSSELLINLLVKRLTEMESEDFSAEVPDKAGSSNKTAIDKLSRNDLKRLIELSLEHQEKTKDEDDEHAADDGVESTLLTRPSPIELQSRIEKHPEVMAQCTSLPSTHRPDPPIESHNQTQKAARAMTSAEKLHGGAGSSMDRSGTSKESIPLTKEEIEKKYPPRLMEKIDLGINRILRDFLLEPQTESQKSITNGRPTAGT